MPEIITSEKLAIVEKLFSAFHEQHIMYCHWKSNEHLDASMRGDTDLDVLFDIKDKKVLEAVLASLDFKKFSSVQEKTYKDIEDYIGFDKESGRIVHLHTHYRLTLGEPYLKSYQLGLEPIILRRRFYNESFGIYCIDPHQELALLFIRESLKVRNRDKLKNFFGRLKVNANALRECSWLQQQVSYMELHTTVRKIFEEADVPYRIMSAKMNFNNLLRLSGIVKRQFADKRIYSPIRAILKRWYREVHIKSSRALARFFHQPVLSRRINPRGGVIVALIGADGSGKSTVSENLRLTFEKKLDVFKVYFGRGDGRRSFLRMILLRFKKAFTGKDHRRKPINSFSSGSRKSAIRTLYKFTEALAVALEKRSNLKLITMAKKKGALVICDRYPQNQFMGYNDGPLLSEYLNSKNPLFRVLSRFEQSIYDYAEKIAPDLVVKLIADAHIVEARKPNETRYDVLVSKINAVKALKVNTKSNVLVVDAVQPLSTVLQTVKNATWNAL